MHTNQLGVIELELENKEVVRVTNLEWTLIDITVRSVYAGEVSKVEPVNYSLTRL